MEGNEWTYFLSFLSMKESLTWFSKKVEKHDLIYSIFMKQKLEKWTDSSGEFGS